MNKLVSRHNHHKTTTVLAVESLEERQVLSPLDFAPSAWLPTISTPSEAVESPGQKPVVKTDAIYSVEIPPQGAIPIGIQNLLFVDIVLWREGPIKRDDPPMAKTNQGTEMLSSVIGVHLSPDIDRSHPPEVELESYEHHGPLYQAAPNVLPESIAPFSVQEGNPLAEPVPGVQVLGENESISVSESLPPPLVVVTEPADSFLPTENSSPRMSGLLTDARPFSLASMERALQQFLDQMGEVHATATSWVSSDGVWPWLFMGAASTIIGQEIVRWRPSKTRQQKGKSSNCRVAFDAFSELI